MAKSKNTGPLGKEITRRELIKWGIVGVAATYLGMQAKEALFEDKEDDSHDVLVDADKFRAFVNKWQTLSEELAEDPERPIPYEVYLAVAMHESDSGTSELAENANNVFGVIAKDGWDGDVYDKPTEEEVQSSDLDRLKAEHSDLTVLSDYGDGRLRVRYTRPFRQYASVEDSFKDFTSKLYHQYESGAYRYADVITYLQNDGRDPSEVVRLMSDDDEEGEARYATGREWRDGVTRYIALVQEITGNVSGGEAPADPTLPDSEPKIDMSEIDFSELDQPRDEGLIERMKDGINALSLEGYREFLKTGVTQEYERVKNLLASIQHEREGSLEEYLSKKYGRGDVDFEYIVWHAWVNGVTDGGTEFEGPTGNSHKITLSDQIQSWFRNSDASCGYIMSDNSPADIWQLTPTEFGRTNHVTEILDPAVSETHKATNGNAIGMEVQADSVYDIRSEQFTALLYWTTEKLFNSGKIKQGMERFETDAIVEQVVVGHGKNAENGHLEFGAKYTKPLIQALQQFVYIAVKA